MNALIQTTIGESRGLPRFWLEGKRLAKAGFEAGQRLRLSIHKGRVVLRSLKAGEHGESVRVSHRSRTQQPLLEVRGDFLAKLFGAGARVVIKMRKGRMSIARHHLDQRQAARGARLIERLHRGEPLRVASMYHGGGVIDCAIHEGLRETGAASYCALASEIEGKYIEASLRNNPHLFRDDSLILNAPVEQLNFSGGRLPEVEVLVGGVPCTGASSSGKARNRIAHAEQHASAGAQFYAYLRMVELLSPAVVILENVPGYQSTASYAVVLSVLKTLGYRVTDRVLDGNEFGALEGRERLAMVAVCESLEGFEIEDVAPVERKPATLAEVLDDAAETADKWRDYAYLRDPEARDKAAGKGFRRQLLTPEAERVPTITREYQKVRSTDPQLAHPSDPRLSRLFTPAEHARIKGIPGRIIEGLSATVAHEVLGQSVVFPAFRALGRALGQWMQRLATAPATMAA